MSDSRTNRQWPDDQQQDSPQSYALSGRIMLASIIILFVVVVVLVLLHLYARWYLLRLQLRNVSRRRNRPTRIVFYVDSNRAVPSLAGGLDASVLKSLPVFVYTPESDGSLPECAVCLSEFEAGETGRILPKCKHSFHTDCIDMWFGSNSTCPLCRSPVEPVETEITSETTSVGELTETTSVRCVGELTETTSVQRVGAVTETASFADGTKRVDVRIDVPNRNELAAEIEFQLTSPSQGFRSPGSRLLSLKRIINMSRKSPAVSPSAGVGPSCVPVAADSDLESAQESSVR
ncbi:hypothetical protein L1987_02793 [Smallanthus sonchifolius]|uniref:Uncharacterized protein n=1 Tax=Smallanthus sonchifolius TaxID=185202 RepID=A0ACB9K8Z5_9ASTR|nr:hypothetical protein L1987_02793 [Smallanthus sonchifolius]